MTFKEDKACSGCSFSRIISQNENGRQMFKKKKKKNWKPGNKMKAGNVLEGKYWEKKTRDMNEKECTQRETSALQNVIECGLVLSSEVISRDCSLHRAYITGLYSRTVVSYFLSSSN